MKNRSLVLLSGEATALPESEAKALYLAYDPRAKFASPEARVMIVDSEADPYRISSRVAFARRVGHLLDDPKDASAQTRGRRVRFREFRLNPGLPQADPISVLKGLDFEADLKTPELEITLVRGTKDYLALTSPTSMNQAWAKRRPRVRAYFHPSAIFPKLSRALVNLTRVLPGETFLDPFSGTGSLAIEASIVGARVIAADRSETMARGSLANMKRFGQEWLGVLRADALLPPAVALDSIATDIPYGRASSTQGSGETEIVKRAISTLPSLVKPGAHIVIMHSDKTRIMSNGEVLVEDEMNIYVHKLLTRTITVLRRREG